MVQEKPGRMGSASRRSLSAERTEVVRDQMGYADDAMAMIRLGVGL
jgi:hypothetical protein